MIHPWLPSGFTHHTGITLITMYTLTFCTYSTLDWANIWVLLLFGCTVDNLVKGTCILASTKVHSMYKMFNWQNKTRKNNKTRFCFIDDCVIHRKIAISYKKKKNHNCLHFKEFISQVSPINKVYKGRNYTMQ